MSVGPMISHPRADGVRQAESATQALPDRGLGEMSIDDWDVLFRAVETRLRQAMADSTTGGPGQAARTIVLECLEALGQLHGALVHVRGRTERVERELHEARAALARIRGELGDPVPSITARTNGPRTTA